MKEKINGLVNKYSHMWFYPYAKQLFIQIKSNEISNSSATLSYYFLLSLFPFIIFLLSLLRFTPLADLNIYAEIVKNLPFEVSPMIDVIMRELFSLSSDAVTWLSMVVVAYSSSKVIKSLTNSVNKAYDVKESRNIVYRWILSVVLTVFLAFSMVVLLLSLVFGKVIINELFIFFKISEYFFFVSHFLRLLFPIITMYLIYSIFYKVGPNRKIKFRYTVPGALFATAGSIIGSIIFGVYVNYFASYNITYGSLGGIVVFLIWINVVSMIIIIGAEINGAYLSVDESLHVD